MFVEITCNEIVNLNHVAVIRKRHDELDECFKIYVNTIGEDVVVLKFDTEEEMEKTWMWLRNTLSIQERWCDTE